ncbi:MAG: hypothetical protein ACREHD_05495, partial [Pirellulales bacterium]
MLRRSVVLLLGAACWQVVSAAAFAQYFGPPARARQGGQPTVARRPMDRPGALERNQMPVRNREVGINELITPI